MNTKHSLVAELPEIEAPVFEGTRPTAPSRRVSGASALVEEIGPCLLPKNVQRFGRYTLLYRFASGGMASLYAARLDGSDGFEKTVAIKMMHSHLTVDAEFVKMFIDEARVASRVTHSNVVQILELGRIGNRHYIVMEYVEGEPVTALLRRTKPPLTHCAYIAACAAAGLHAAHELTDAEGRPLEVIHRDVSPDNILVSYDGAVKIADFGVARARNTLHSTSAGSLKGKFSYMAPEQVRGEAIDRRVDVFALGIVLYEMTTWRRLFKRATESAVLQAVIECDVRPPSDGLPDFPAALEAIVLKALCRDPDGRYQSAHELRIALEDYVASTGQAVTGSRISDLMRTTFADRYEQKQKLKHDYRDVPHDYVPDIEIQSSGTPSLAQVSQQVPRSRAGLYLLLGIIFAATSAFCTALGIRHYQRLADGANDAHGANAAAAAAKWTLAARPVATPLELDGKAQVHVTVTTEPPSASITVDGKPVEAPYRGLHRTSARPLEVEVSAPGHAKAHVTLRPTADVEQHVVLTKLPARGLRAASRGNRANARPSLRGRGGDGKRGAAPDSTRKPALDDRELLTNPYAGM